MCQAARCQAYSVVAEMTVPVMVVGRIKIIKTRLLPGTLLAWTLGTLRNQKNIRPAVVIRGQHMFRVLILPVIVVEMQSTRIKSE